MLKTPKKAEFEIVAQKTEVVGNNSASASPKIKVLDSELELLAIDLAAQGKTIKFICEVLNIDYNNIVLYQKNNPSFKKSFEAARSDGLEALADSILDIAENEPDVLRARVKSDNIKWLLSKRKAHVYGDKLELNVNATVDIGQALQEAKSRAALATVSNELTDLLS